MLSDPGATGRGADELHAGKAAQLIAKKTVSWTIVMDHLQTCAWRSPRSSGAGHEDPWGSIAHRPGASRRRSVGSGVGRVLLSIEIGVLCASLALSLENRNPSCYMK